MSQEFDKRMDHENAPSINYQQPRGKERFRVAVAKVVAFDLAALLAMESFSLFVFHHPADPEVLASIAVAVGAGAYFASKK